MDNPSWNEEKEHFQSFSWCSVFIPVGWTPCAALCFFICIPWWFIVTSKRYFPQLFFCACFSTERSGHWEALLAASSEQWPRLGRILHVFPVALSFSTLLSRQLIARRYRPGSFSQEPQHTATHSDGVTRSVATEPPLSEAQRAARRGYAAAPHISGGSLRQSAHHWYHGRTSVCVPTWGRLLHKKIKSFEKTSARKWRKAKVRRCCSEGGRAQR